MSLLQRVVGDINDAGDTDVFLANARDVEDLAVVFWMVLQTEYRLHVTALELNGEHQGSIRLSGGVRNDQVGFVREGSMVLQVLHTSFGRSDDVSLYGDDRTFRGGHGRSDGEGRINISRRRVFVAGISGIALVRIVRLPRVVSIRLSGII